MAHKKGVGSSQNGRESHSKRLGVKIYGGQFAQAGTSSSGNVEPFIMLDLMLGWVKTTRFLPCATVLLSSGNARTTNHTFPFTRSAPNNDVQLKAAMVVNDIQKSPDREIRRFLFLRANGTRLQDYYPASYTSLLPVRYPAE
jgi:hypothetical protein